jgi:hypothetical protein
MELTEFTTDIFNNNIEKNNFMLSNIYILITTIIICIIVVKIITLLHHFIKKEITITIIEDNLNETVSNNHIIKIKNDLHEKIKNIEVINDNNIQKIENNLYDIIKIQQNAIDKIPEILIDKIESNFVEFYKTQQKYYEELFENKIKVMEQQILSLEKNIDIITKKIDTYNQEQYFFSQVEKLKSKYQTENEKYIRNIENEFYELIKTKQIYFDEYIKSNKKLAIDIYKFIKVAIICKPRIPADDPFGTDQLVELSRILDCIYYKYIEYDTSIEIDSVEMRSIVQDIYNIEPNLKKLIEKYRS